MDTKTEYLEEGEAFNGNMTPSIHARDKFKTTIFTNFKPTRYSMF